MPANQRSKEREAQDLLEIARLWKLLEENHIAFDQEETLKNRVEEVLAAGKDPLLYLDALKPGSSLPHLFLSYFHGRDDAFFRRTKKGAWYQPCANEQSRDCPKNQPDFVWTKNPCRGCALKKGRVISEQDVLFHLRGNDPYDTNIVKIGALQEAGTAFFLLFDPASLKTLDSAAQKDALQALMRVLKKEGFDWLWEKSPEKEGYRLWLFFETAMDAQKAADFGRMLILQAMLEEGLHEPELFNCLLPDGAARKAGDLGRTVELPLQNRKAHEGRSLFLDETGKPAGEQWVLLENTKKISTPEVLAYSVKPQSKALFALLQPVMENEEGDSFDYASALFSNPEDLTAFRAQDVQGEVKIHLQGQIRIETDNLNSRMQALLLLMGCYWNPEYQGRNARFATGPHVIALSRYDAQSKSLLLPGGLFETLKSRLEQDGIAYTVIDDSSAGMPLEIELQGVELFAEQKELITSLQKHDRGILEAATGTGKTIMAAGLIAQKQTSTLILVYSQEILKGWIKTLNNVLHFQNPDYEKKLSSRKYPGKIGVLQASTNSLCGRVDVAMVPSLASKDNLEEICKGYGMVLIDECHHAASPTTQKILQNVRAKSIYGLSATPERNDGYGQSVYLQLGPVASRYTSKEQMAGQSFKRYIIQRLSEFKPLESDTDYLRIVQQAASDPVRNRMILNDVAAASASGRTVLVLTRFVEHARFLARWLERLHPKMHLLVYAGDPKEKQENSARLKELAGKPSVVLVGTYSSVGEGFDFPPLDTLMLALPIRSSIQVSQAIGRIHRQVENKKDVLVYDYIDEQCSMLAGNAKERLAEYQNQGYERYSRKVRQANEKEELDLLPNPAGAAFPEIGEYNAASMLPDLQNDLQAVRKNVAIAARSLSYEKLEELFDWLKPLSGKRVRVDLFLEEADDEIRQAIADHNIHLHIHTRIIEPFLILDKQKVWQGGLFDEDPAAMVYALLSFDYARDLLELRRKEEIALIRGQKEVPA